MILEWLAARLVPIHLVFAMLVVSLFLALVRLLRGPTLPDRVVALDLMSTLAVGVMAAYAIVTDQPVFLDVAVLLALIAFLGTVAFALYVGKGGMR
jgi:multicomponent Na+:H+ antiporter subunit F